jgi:hypothetical protein
MSDLASRYSVSSDPLRTERRVELAVVVLSGLLVLQLLWGGYSVIFPSLPEPVLPAPDSLQVGSVTDPLRVTAEQRSLVRQRPIFWATRQPLDVAEEQVDVRTAADREKEKKPGKISGVKLSGVFGAGDSAGIIVQLDGKKHRLMVGQELNGWRLESVTPVKARFRRKGEHTSLQLDRGEPISTGQAGSAGDSGAAALAPSEPGALVLGGRSRARPKKTK